MTAGGAALARDGDGRVVFVEGALPGERVRAVVTSARRDYAHAVTVEVVDPSPDRVAPPCAARAEGCGGCSWQHVAGGAQARLKVDIVIDALRRIARVDPVAGLAITTRRPSAPARRTTVRLGVGPEGRAGERRRSSHDLVIADACQAVHPRLEELVVAGRYHGAAEVVLRVGVASGERAAWPLAPAGRGRRPAAGSSTPPVEVPADVDVGPDAVVHEEVAGAWLEVHIGSFFQSGPDAADALVAAVDAAAGDALPPGGHLVDAYAGVGLFGATVGAARGVRVTAIETSPAAVADAETNLARAGVDHVVVRSEVGQWRPETGGPPVDVVVADPSRTGLGRPGTAAVAGAQAARIILVSCDPASLARDTALLATAGYTLAGVEVVDAFPDTFHIEAVARFDRR
jgi:23S rRNA (uracil1939-C5)-methyltransferase